MFNHGPGRIASSLDPDIDVKVGPGRIIAYGRLSDLDHGGCPTDHLLLNALTAPFSLLTPSVHEKISSQFWALRRPPGKALKRRNIWIFQVFGTQPDGMHRRPKCEIVFE